MGWAPHTTTGDSVAPSTCPGAGSAQPTAAPVQPDGEAVAGSALERPELLASATGAWPGPDPRAAAAAGFAQLADAYPPVPAIGTPVEVAGKRGVQAWRIDTVGTALSLLDGLHAELTSFGWRLTLSTAGSRDRDLSRARSARVQTWEACEEYGGGFGGRMLLSLPGPWALLRRLSLPDGKPALGDAGARRDVVQSYAAGVQELVESGVRTLGAAPRVRLFEPDLDEILTGRVPTVSGYRTLAAVADQQVTAALRSFIRRTGDDTILALPRLAAVWIAGKRLAHRELAQQAGVTALAIPLPGAGTQSPRPTAHAQPIAAGQDGPTGLPSDAQGPADGQNGLMDAVGLQGWEELAQAHESGMQLWLHLPADAGCAPTQIKRWVAAVSVPWHRVGMSGRELPDIGILTGCEPLAPGGSSTSGGQTAGTVPDDPAYGAAQYQLAINLAQALREENE